MLKFSEIFAVTPLLLLPNDEQLDDLSLAELPALLAGKLAGQLAGQPDGCLELLGVGAAQAGARGSPAAEGQAQERLLALLEGPP